MDYMGQAVSLARLALGRVSPNPAVGAVVVRDGAVIGQGHTQLPGSGHAEVVALAQAGDAAEGGVIYVTLEPCCHQGRTPPCTEAIIAAGIAEVHFSMLDPNPLVSGKGEKELTRHGIRTFVGQSEDSAREIVEAYAKYITTGLPFVTAKFAMSLDGKIATRTGDSRWISSRQSRKYVHSLRYATDAIMVGVNTVLADDPQLTSRCDNDCGDVRKRPLRVIVDSGGRTPLAARVFTGSGRALLAVARSPSPEHQEALARMDAEVVELPSDNGQVDLSELFSLLGRREITSVLVEGGSGLLGSLFDRRLVDKVVAFVAPTIVGGADAMTAVGGRGVDRIADSLRLERVTTVSSGQDVMVTGYVGG